MDATEPVEINLKHADKLYINGEWVAPVKGGSIEIISPHNGQVVGVVAQASEEDMDKAVAAARNAFDNGPWPRMSVEERCGYLQKFHAALAPRAAELSKATIEQIGMLASMAPMMTGGGIGGLEFMAHGAAGYQFVEERPAMDPSNKAYVIHEPVGVVVAISPWNAPFTIMINKVAPALLAGCPVIMKPSPETPIEAYIIAEAADEAGLPAGVLNLVTAHRDASDHLVRNHGVDKVSFTGSTVAGKHIGAVMAERVARCTLELGGKSAAIVCEDFDVATAAKILASTITISCGQVCMTLSRALVPKHLQAEFAEAIKAEMARVKVGDPSDPTSQMGPLAMKRQADRVRELIKAGVDEGATLVCGGGKPAGTEGDCYVEPTLFSDVESGMTIAQEEIFGPVLCLIGYEDEADAIRIANDSKYGLFGAVFTPDADKAYRIARSVRTGTVAHNGFVMDFTLPFGGFKQSGIGREGGVTSISSFTETKAIVMQEAPSKVY